MLNKKQFYINGTWVDPIQPKDFSVINPSTEDVYATISLASKEDVNKAVQAAKVAFQSWAFTTKEERLSLIEKLYTIYKSRWSEMAEAISNEMGAPIDFANELRT